MQTNQQQAGGKVDGKKVKHRGVALINSSRGVQPAYPAHELHTAGCRKQGLQSLVWLRPEWGISTAAPRHNQNHDPTLTAAGANAGERIYHLHKNLSITDFKAVFDDGRMGGKKKGAEGALLYDYQKKRCCTKDK